MCIRSFNSILGLTSGLVYLGALILCPVETGAQDKTVPGACYTATEIPSNTVAINDAGAIVIWGLGKGIQRADGRTIDLNSIVPYEAVFAGFDNSGNVAYNVRTGLDSSRGFVYSVATNRTREVTAIITGIRASVWLAGISNGTAFGSAQISAGMNNNTYYPIYEQVDGSRYRTRVIGVSSPRQDSTGSTGIAAMAGPSVLIEGAMRRVLNLHTNESAWFLSEPRQSPEDYSFTRGKFISTDGGYVVGSSYAPSTQPHLPGHERAVIASLRHDSSGRREYSRWSGFPGFANESYGTNSRVYALNREFLVGSR